MLSSNHIATIQAARNVANQYLLEFNSFSTKAIDNIEESLKLANQKFDFAINEIR